VQPEYFARTSSNTGAAVGRFAALALPAMPTRCDDFKSFEVVFEKEYFIVCSKYF